MNSSLIKSILFPTPDFDIILELDAIGAVELYERDKYGTKQRINTYDSFETAIKIAKEVYKPHLKVVSGSVDCKINLFCNC